MTPQRPRKTLRPKPKPRNIRLKVAPKLTLQELRRLTGRANADLRSIGDYVLRLVEADLRKRSSRPGSRVRGAGPHDRRVSYDIGMTLSVEQQQRVKLKAQREGRSLSSYVAKVIVEGVRG
jgi:hypothetical protein